MRGKAWVSVIFKTLPLVIIACGWLLMQSGVPLLAANAISVTANPATITTNGTSAITGDNGGLTNTVMLSISPSNLGNFASCSCTSRVIIGTGNNAFFNFSDTFVSNGTPGTATITASDYNNKVPSGTTTVTINAPAPILNVAPTSLNFTAIAGQTAHSVSMGQVTLTALNSAVNYTTNISYGNGQSTGWLNVNPTTGTVARNQPVQATVSADNSNLPAGIYNATLTFYNTSNQNLPSTVAVTFNNQAPPTTVVTTTVSTTPVVTTTASPTTPVSTTPTVQASGTITISGKVLVNGVGASGLTVRLNGGNYQQTDSSGNYSFTNLQAGRYQPVVLVDPTKYASADNLPKATDVNGYVYAVIPVSNNQNVTGINFNLTTAISPTATAVATTTEVTTNTVTTVALTPTPAATTASGLPPAPTPTPTINSDFPGCQPLAPLVSVLSFNYCTTQSPNDPNQFRVDVVVYNATNVNIDLSNTLIFNLQDGTQVRKPAVSTGKIAVSADNTQLIWSGFQLAPGQSANLSFYITKAASSLTLINSIKVTGIDQLLKAPFSAILPAILAQAGRGQSPIYPIGGGNQGGGNQGGGDTVSNTPAPNLPHTGAVQTPQSNEPNLVALFSIGMGLFLGSGCAFGLFWQLRKRLR